MGKPGRPVSRDKSQWKEPENARYQSGAKTKDREARAEKMDRPGRGAGMFPQIVGPKFSIGQDWGISGSGHQCTGSRAGGGASAALAFGNFVTTAWGAAS